MRKRFIIPHVALLLLLLTSIAQAVPVNRTWIGVSTPGDYSVAANWSPAAVPLATDSVFIPAGAPAITAGLNQSAVALATFYVEPGYTKTIASSAAYLQIAATTFVFSGTGVGYIDLGSSNITAVVTTTATGSTGNYGLYLKGSNLLALACSGGNTAVAMLTGETSTVATTRMSGAGTQCTLGTGVTLTTGNVSNGTLTINCAATTCNVFGGNFCSAFSGAITTINVTQGNCYPNSSGTVTNLNCLGGMTDTTKFGIPRTVTNHKQNPAQSSSMTRIS